MSPLVGFDSDEGHRVLVEVEDQRASAKNRSVAAAAAGEMRSTPTRNPCTMPDSQRCRTRTSASPSAVANARASSRPARGARGAQ
jgi:hypothetical protein